MAHILDKLDPSKISNRVDGRFPLALVRQCIILLWRAVKEPSSQFTPGSGSPGTGTGPAATLATRIPLSWEMNGPLRAITDADGYRRVERDCEIVSVSLSRVIAGTAGSTVLDLSRIPAGSPPSAKASLYVTQANRPTINYADTDHAVLCAMPDVIALGAGDLLAPDIDSVESGTPRTCVLDVVLA
jgi:hypothetical protein